MKFGRVWLLVTLLIAACVTLFKISSTLRASFHPRPPSPIDVFMQNHNLNGPVGKNRRPTNNNNNNDNKNNNKQQNVDFIKTNNNNNNREEHSSSASSFFLPGSLGLTKWETLAQCYVDPQIYEEHLPSNAYCVVSEKYKLIYYLVPKSGSSTNREVMTNSLEGRETSTRECDQLAEAKKGYRTIGFVRDPANRIYSSYEESIARKLNDVNSIPKHLRRFVDGMPNYKAYEKLFDRPHLLTERFEQFLEDWDGKLLFDNHLSLQVPLLAHRDGRTRSFVWLGEVSKLDADWERASRLLKFPSPTVIHGRSFPRRMNTSLVTPQAKRRICKLLALDFCCLNFPFPSECLSDTEEPLGCTWKHFPEFNQKLIVPVGGPS